jgi:hypothetical protein
MVDFHLFNFVWNYEKLVELVEPYFYKFSLILLIILYSESNEIFQYYFRENFTLLIVPWQNNRIGNKKKNNLRKKYGENNMLTYYYWSTY